MVIDLATALVAVLLAFLVRFGERASGNSSTQLAFAIGMPVIWLLCLGVSRAYEPRFLGAGTIELERYGRAFLQLTAVTTVTAFVLKADLARGFILLALAFTLVLGFAGRCTARRALHRWRREHRALTPVLAVGDVAEILRFSDTLAANEHTGLRLVAACLPDLGGVSPSAEGVAAIAERNIAVSRGVDTLTESLTASGAQTVAVVSRHITGERLRWLAWQMEGIDADLVVIPGLTEVAGRRLEIQQVGDLPLLHVAQPEFTGMRRVLKAAFDRTAAILALLLLSPVLVLIAVLVRLTSRGPAFFVQTRVGKDGQTFRMVKFRTMEVGAEAKLAELLPANEVAGGALFKMRNDPRVTRIGRLMRRFSIDELPQLVNVLSGSMSFVGPRPPLPTEVAKYADSVHRRLLVKPGMTGLWQISGRSDLSSEDSVRLDLRYVEGWSLTLDMIVLMKTIQAVVRGWGAY
jgi:exopolysaccharide biosynthesis polyprenyl glycosylphosphotransferase